MGSQGTQEIEMADKSNYADRPSANDTYLPPGHLPINFGARTYDPTAGGDDGEGGAHSSLFEHSLGGDWSWKPQRDRLLGKSMVAFKGVAPGAAELYRAQAFPRS